MLSPNINIFYTEVIVCKLQNTHLIKIHIICIQGLKENVHATMNPKFLLNIMEPSPNNLISVLNIYSEECRIGYSLREGKQIVWGPSIEEAAINPEIRYFV